MEEENILTDEQTKEKARNTAFAIRQELNRRNDERVRIEEEREKKELERDSKIAELEATVKSMNDRIFISNNFVNIGSPMSEKDIEDAEIKRLRRFAGLK